LALPSTGSVLAWGYNNDGELGNGTTTSSTTPVAVSLPVGTTVTAIAAGGVDSLALTSTGSVLAWGEAVLGNGSNTGSTTPVAVSLPAGTTVTAIAAGYDHSLALTSTGSVLAWGDNAAGELGNGTTGSGATPVAVSLPAGTTITAIAAGSEHSLALTSTGSVLAWGNNSEGVLGNGTKTNSSTPIAVALPAGTTVTAIATGSEYSHSLALTSTGSVLAWGNNDYGELGNGTTTSSTTPVAVTLPAGTTVTAIAADDFSSLALTR
jgi:alpha-tubulin suppressor-like RCC1 family protein